MSAEHSQLLMMLVCMVGLLACGDGSSDDPSTSCPGDPECELPANADTGVRPGVDRGTSSMEDTGMVTGNDQGVMVNDAGEPIDEDMGMPPIEVAPHPNALNQDTLFVCGNEPGASPARIRRLNRREWLRNIGQSTSSPAARNPLNPDKSLRFPTYSQDVSLDVATLDQFMDVTGVPGGSWTRRYGNPRLDLVIDGSPELRCLQDACAEMSCESGFTCVDGRCREGTCETRGCPNSHRCESGTCVFDSELLPDNDCVTQFVTFLLERGVLFRRPDAQEVEQLVDFVHQQMAQEGPGGSNRNRTIINTVQAAWLTTGALFRTELGGEADGAGRRHLTDSELGLALSYALSDRASGAPVYVHPFRNPEGFLPGIRAAVEAGTISDPDTIAQLVRDYGGGMDAGTLDSDADPDELPEEITALDTDDTRGAYARAVAEHGGRLDLRQDFGVSERARRGEYFLSDKLTGFFRAWLGYDEAGQIFKDRPEATSRFDDGDPSQYRPALVAWNNALNGFYGHEPTLVQAMDDTIARVVVEDQAVLSRLLTTRLFYVPSSVSNPHGGNPVAGYLYDIDSIANPIGDNRGARWQIMPDGQRAGVLTHPAWLAAHGGNFENDPSAVHRGKWVREHLLCGVVPDVPITVDAQLDPETVHLSARERVADKTEAPECVGCHMLMNPLGYAFETFNHAGYVRADDHGMTPSGATSLVAMPEEALNATVDGPAAMMALFADSTHVKRCFIRQNFRYFMGRDETRNDACTLSQMENAYDESGGSMFEMLIALFNSDAFRYRFDTVEETP